MSEQTIFGRLPGGRTTWAVGSIHGDVTRLAVLHRSLANHLTPQDNLVYLGNVLGHGSDILATVNEVLLFRRAVLARHLTNNAGTITVLRGRQEEMWHKLLQIQFAPSPRQVLDWMLSQGVQATLEAYGGDCDEGRRAANTGAVAVSQWTNRLRAAVRAHDGHDPLFSSLRRAAYTADGAILLVSAGIDPSRPLSEQTDSFWWGGRSFDDIEPGWGGFARIIRGFDPHAGGARIFDVTATLDGGCGFGGSLVAGCFAPNGSLVDTIEV